MLPDQHYCYLFLLLFKSIIIVHSILKILVIVSENISLRLFSILVANTEHRFSLGAAYT